MFYNLIVFHWERLHPIFSIDDYPPNSAFTILVLGSGSSQDKFMPPSMLLGQEALSRIVEAIRISQRYPKAKIVTSGACLSCGSSGAKILKESAVEIGVDSNRIFLQESPRNTHEEAVYFFKNFYQANDTVVLVTSALHMPRAFLHFKDLGVDKIISAPCGFQTYNKNRISVKSFWPRFDLWNKYGRLNKEIIGYYFGL